MKQKESLILVRSTIILCSILLTLSCTSKKKSQMEKQNNSIDSPKNLTTYGDDVTFMENYIDLIQLTDTTNNSKVAISAALQGRIMTSSAFGENGRSYGWINRDLFKSKDTLEHIKVFGGEERFWLGPEGGQYSIFFKKGAAFTLADWYTPKYGFTGSTLIYCHTLHTELNCPFDLLTVHYFTATLYVQKYTVLLIY